jgi:hypothetical protein
MTLEDRCALITARRVALAVTMVVNETPTGAPSGALYAALMAYLSVDQFEARMRALVAAERISRRGDVYFPAGQQQARLCRNPLTRPPPRAALLIKQSKKIKPAAK